MKMPAEKKKKLMVIFCFAGLAFSALMILFSLDFNLTELMPDETLLAEQQQQLEKLQKEEKELSENYKAIQSRQQQIDTITAAYWDPAIHGDHEVVIRERLENIARMLNIKNPGFGTVRTSKVSDNIFAVETDITFSASLADGLDFICEIESMDVDVFWKRFEMAVDQRGGTSSIQWNATIRIPAVTEKISGEDAK